MPDIATPNQSISTINTVMLELYKYGKDANYKDLENLIDLHRAVISQCLSASRDLGITKSAGERGQYEFTEVGRKYANALSYDNEDEAKQYLKEIILNNENWSFVIDYLKRQNGLELNPYNLVKSVELQLKKNWSDRMRERMRTSYVSVLEYSGIVEAAGNKIIPRIKTITDNQIDEIKKEEENIEEYDVFETNDFKFVIKKKELFVLDFAESQFISWIKYLKNMYKK